MAKKEENTPTRNDDILDDLAHDIRNTLMILTMEGNRLDRALAVFLKAVQRCPFAGKPGAGCKYVSPEKSERNKP